jgi:fructose-1,6-bisphosphatase/inositol monophosphatase family enzyme
VNGAEFTELWLPRLEALCREMRDATRRTMAEALAKGDLASVARPVGHGAGDVTYGIDRECERVLERWLESTASTQAISMLTEETGWRHMAPSSSGRAREIDGFDHGGPRIVVDPIDGTRNLMTDLRSAWTVLGIAGPGADEPRMSDLVAGILCEIPDTRAAKGRLFAAVRGECCWLYEESLEHRASAPRRALATDADARVDHGYFPFFKYMADLRPAISAVEARFFERLAEHESAEVRNCYDDQYISNGGHLALLALGTYRMIADLRAHLAKRRGRPTLTTKPYDVAGAIVCARAAGCVITDVSGGELDFPIDASTPLSFVGYVNAATRARLAPHLAAALKGA